jgi:crotonobetaine/carnitine-CoA ligase
VRARHDLGRVTKLMISSAPARQDTKRAVMEMFRSSGLFELYGATEIGWATMLHPEEQFTKLGSVGRECVGSAPVKLLDENGDEVPDGEPGELVLRHREPFAFATGYFGMPEKTVEAWRNLWFHTGDRVVREADGAFRFIDRIKDAIRRRGENISSYEVEQVLASHPGVAAVAVYPVPADLGEDEVMAAVIPKEKPLHPADLAQFCETRLPKFAIPRYIDLVDELPRTQNGKVQKYRLRERGVTPTTWDRFSGR